MHSNTASSLNSQQLYTDTCEKFAAAFRINKMSFGLFGVVYMVDCFIVISKPLDNQCSSAQACPGLPITKQFVAVIVFLCHSILNLLR